MGELTAADTLRERFPTLEVVRERVGYLHVEVGSGSLMEVLLACRDQLGITVLQLVSVVDLVEDDLLRMTYVLESPGHDEVLLVSARFPREGCTVPTASGLWKAAEAFERELREMYGIDFPGSPRLEEDFVLEGWDGPPPMLRDFDTLEFAMERFGKRRQREHRDPRSYVGETVGEWDLPLPPSTGRGEEDRS